MGGGVRVGRVGGLPAPLNAKLPRQPPPRQGALRLVGVAHGRVRALGAPGYGVAEGTATTG